MMWMSWVMNYGLERFLSSTVRGRKGSKKSYIELFLSFILLEDEKVDYQERRERYLYDYSHRGYM